MGSLPLTVVFVGIYHVMFFTREFKIKWDRWVQKVVKRKSLTEALNLLKSQRPVMWWFWCWRVELLHWPQKCWIHLLCPATALVLSHPWSAACHSTAGPDNMTLIAFHYITMLVSVIPVTYFHPSAWPANDTTNGSDFYARNKSPFCVFIFQILMSQKAQRMWDMCSLCRSKVEKFIHTFPSVRCHIYHYSVICNDYCICNLSERSNSIYKGRSKWVDVDVCL